MLRGRQDVQSCGCRPCGSGMSKQISGAGSAAGAICFGAKCTSVAPCSAAGG